MCVEICQQQRDETKRSMSAQFRLSILGATRQCLGMA
jgi:hypothetical protein